MAIARHTEQAHSNHADHSLRRRRVGTVWGRLLARAAEALRHARETGELTALDDRELRDIGVNRYEVAQELRRRRPPLSREEADALVARAHQARSEALFQVLTSGARWLLRSRPASKDLLDRR